MILALMSTFKSKPDLFFSVRFGVETQVRYVSCGFVLNIIFSRNEHDFKGWCKKVSFDASKSFTEMSKYSINFFFALQILIVGILISLSQLRKNVIINFDFHSLLVFKLWQFDSKFLITYNKINTWIVGFSKVLIGIIPYHVNIDTDKV